MAQANSNKLSEKPPKISRTGMKRLIDSTIVSIQQMTSSSLAYPPRESEQWCRVVASAMEGPKEISILEQFFRSRGR